ncbi:MAG: AAA-like domain-containing protein [Bacteroidales bacterium]|nr:AAA-like domain-containing protein [Bacteroidales bacterium]
MRRFNTTGTCYPDEHYMVDITKRLDIIEQKVANGEYITINRGRQYGKTTTLYHLTKRLSKDYVVFSISFESFNQNNFATDDRLAFSLVNLMKNQIKIRKNINDYVRDAITAIIDKNSEKKEISVDSFSEFIENICSDSDKPIVLIIDEVDNASNYESFINLLRFLRDKYLNRRDLPTFKSVILAGVYDIKNLKLKVRPESEHQYNSPWNIAVPFDEDMSLSKSGIEKMLAEYEADHKTGMDIPQMAQLITDYTSGYPFFVSKICQLIDEGNLGWNKEGSLKAIKILLDEKNTFFDDLAKKMEDFPKMKDLLKGILYNGFEVSFNTYYKHIEIAAMFNYIKNVNNKVAVFNRILETWMYNLFITEEQIESRIYDQGSIEKNQFVENGVLKMDKILERFAVHFNDIYGGEEQTFKEEEGRRYFMLYIKPIINGTGNYYIEAQTRDRSRTDMIIDYLGTQYIIEMKIWRGNAYNERGEQQLTEYLDYYHVNKGYMLSFCFNQKKDSGVRTIKYGDKEIVEAVV